MTKDDAPRGPFEVSYADPYFVLDPADAGEPPIYTVIGWLVDAPWKGWIGIASERRGEEYAAVTYLPARTCVLHMKELG